MGTRVKKAKNNRLAKNFHRTFIPEKQYLGAILKYAAESGLYDMQTIADTTGIPTGKSSGKAIPTADYAIGMGLAKLQSVGEKKDKQQSLVLTNFGRAVYLGDRFLQEEMTQWIAHLYLCNREGGAELWYQMFWNGSETFGGEFECDDFIRWVTTEVQATDAVKALSPTMRMYEEQASFATCGALACLGGRVIRKKCPIEPTYIIGYAAAFADMLERVGKETKNQLTVEDLESICGFRTVTGWTLPESRQVLGLMEDKGLVTIDRHMQPWIVCFTQSVAQMWTRIYEEFI